MTLGRITTGAVSIDIFQLRLVVHACRSVESQHLPTVPADALLAYHRPRRGPQARSNPQPHYCLAPQCRNRMYRRHDRLARHANTNARATRAIEVFQTTRCRDVPFHSLPHHDQDQIAGEHSVCHGLQQPLHRHTGMPKRPAVPTTHVSRSRSSYSEDHAAGAPDHNAADDDRRNNRDHGVLKYRRHARAQTYDKSRAPICRSAHSRPLRRAERLRAPPISEDKPTAAILHLLSRAAPIDTTHPTAIHTPTTIDLILSPG